MAHQIQHHIGFSYDVVLGSPVCYICAQDVVAGSGLAFVGPVPPLHLPVAVVAGGSHSEHLNGQCTIPVLNCQQIAYGLDVACGNDLVRLFGGGGNNAGCIDM